MKRDYSVQLSQILIVLKNINDNISNLENQINGIKNINAPKVSTHRHLVVIENKNSPKEKNKNV